MSNKNVTFDFSEVEGEAGYRGDLDPERIVWLAWNRCNHLMTTGDEVAFGNSVKALLASIPPDKRREIENSEPEYAIERPVLKYKYYCGVALGTPEHPVMRNGEPWSPVEETVKEIDYYKLYNIIQDKLQEAQLTWKLDKIEVFTGELWEPPVETEDEKLEPATPNT